MNTKIQLGLLLVASMVSGCAMTQGALMTTEEVATYGTKELTAPPAKVFQAVVGALKAQGFAIAVEKPEKGLIKTNRRLIRSAAMGSANYAQAVDYTRSYSAHIEALANGTTRLSLHPYVFAGEQDLLGRKRLGPRG